MSQAERLSGIQRDLTQNGYVKLEDLKRRFEVTRTTIMRDFEIIRDRLGAPLVYDRATNSYRLMVPKTVSSSASYEFPGMWLTPNEAYAVLTLYNVMRRIDPGVLHGALSPLTRPVKRMLGAENFPMRGFDKSIAIDLPGFSLAFKTDLTTLFSGLGTKDTIRLVWVDSDGKRQAKRGTVDQLRLGTNGWSVVFTPHKGDTSNIQLTSVERCDGI